MARWTVAAAAVLAALAAGCLGGDPPEPEEAPAGPLVEGWVVDATRAPVPDATARLAGLGVQAVTDAEGRYELRAPTGTDLVVTIEADGFVPQSRAVSGLSGARQVLNFTLDRVPAAEPYVEVASFEGVLRCGAVATVQEDPSRPHEHQGVRCSQALNDTANRWLHQVPAGLTGMVVEATWQANSELGQAMVLRIVVEGSGEVLGFLEGTSPIRIQLSSAKLAQEAAAGNRVLAMSLEPGAGTGNHEHGAVGVFLEQRFELFASSFFNGPVDPSYSITRT